MIGATIDPKLQEAFHKKFKFQKSRYLVIKVADNKKDLLLEKMGEKDSTLEELKSNLSEDEICFIYFMVRFDSDNRKVIKPILINY